LELTCNFSSSAFAIQHMSITAGSSKPTNTSRYYFIPASLEAVKACIIPMPTHRHVFHFHVYFASLCYFHSPASFDFLTQATHCGAKLCSVAAARFQPTGLYGYEIY